MTNPPTDVTELDESVVEPVPFVRIVGSYPVADGRVETVTLELNLPDDGDEAVVEYEPGDPTAVKSWITDFCTELIREMRRAPAPAVIVLDGQARTVLAGGGHAPGCDGDCGDEQADGDVKGQL